MPGKFLSGSGKRVCRRRLPVGGCGALWHYILCSSPYSEGAVYPASGIAGVFLALWGVLPMMERGAGGE